MCRLLAYSGAPIFLETALTDPPHSLVSQSKTAHESMSSVNADGCGIGWYGERAEPARFRSVHPAWGDENLRSLCRQIRSRLFVGHIRAATSGGVSSVNCHPFVAGRHMFLHNGSVGGFARMRHRVEPMLPEAYYAHRLGTADTEAIFLNALGHDLDKDPIGAVSRSLSDFLKLIADMGLDEAIQLAAILTDGETVWAFRWASRHLAPTLYTRRIETGMIVASEPYDDDRGDWDSVPEDSVTIITADGGVDRQPFRPS